MDDNGQSGIAALVAGIIAKIRIRFTGFFNDPQFTTILLVSSGGTVLLGCTWLYRLMTHDPYLDPGSGAEIPLILLLLAALVLVRLIVLRWRKNHVR